MVIRIVTMPTSEQVCAVCKPGSYDEGVCAKVLLSCGHSAHGDCQHVKWLVSCCFACRNPTTKKEKDALASSFYEGHRRLAEAVDDDEQVREGGQ